MSITHRQIVVIGASGLVGSECISILIERGVDPTCIYATASTQSSGKAIEIDGFAFVLQEFAPSLLNENTLVFQSASNKVAKECIPIAIEAGCTVIDCSSAYRNDSSVPLVIPCVNGELLDTSPRLIASPNCTTIILLTAINSLCTTYEATSITVATYQAASGAGRDGLEALWQESAGKSPVSKGLFPEPIAFNVFCHESPVSSASGLNDEEATVIYESHRILGNESLPIAVTCMRVPVERVHTEAVTISLTGTISKKDLLNELQHAESVVLLDEEGHFPTALKASGGDVVLVGHIRVQHVDDQTVLSLVVCGDQLRTGAAFNAVRIAESLAYKQVQ